MFLASSSIDGTFEVRGDASPQALISVTKAGIKGTCYSLYASKGNISICLCGEWLVPSPKSMLIP